VGWLPVKLDHNERETVRRYLLGQAPLEDSSRVEERLLTDSEFYRELLIVEDELIDQYLSGELSAPERESFEPHFLLPPERQQKLRFARSLKRYVSSVGAAQPNESVATNESSEYAAEVAEHPPKKRPFFSFLPFGNPIVSYALAATILLMVGGASWIVFKNWRTPAPRQPGRVLAAVLTPGLTRDDGEIKKIAIPPGTDTVQLQLQIAGTDQYQSYRALLQTTGGVEKLRTNDLKANATGTSLVVSVQLNAGLLTRGDYYLKLSGLTPRGEYEDVGRYSFRVVIN
jgi:hypothetical protein